MKRINLFSCKRLWALLLLSYLWCVPRAAGQGTTSFTVCPLNVDGLPTSIMGITLNADGGGADGATAIGNYLAGKQYDVLAFSEDFNYNSELMAPLSDLYNSGTYRGGLTTSGLSVDNIQFKTDGLNLLCKKGLSLSNETWAAWNQCYGKFTNGADELITKGYRSYTVAFNDSVVVDFYILHMDAEVDSEDIAARASQWQQLCDVIRASSNRRPKIVMGDTNSRYTRDDILGLFVNPINATGNYVVRDAWIELCKQGSYPPLGSDALMVGQLGYEQGEIVDKVFYINPTDGIQLEPTSIHFDETYTLGDHLPVAVTFTVASGKYIPTAPEQWWVGEEITYSGQPFYIYNVGSHFFIHNSNTPSLTNISQVPVWNFWGTTSGSISNSSDYRLKMNKVLSWNTAVETGSGATTFNFVKSTTSSGAYKFTKSGRLFNLAIEDAGFKYTAAQTQGTWNDWLLISPEQKEAYEEYVKAFCAANRYADFDLPSALASALTSLLSMPANYVACQGADGITQQLTSLVTEIESWIGQQSCEDVTSLLQNPSFEDGIKLGDNQVEGWTVDQGVSEAFSSGVVDGADGASVRNFSPHDGLYVFNTWGGTPQSGYFFCRQNVDLAPGCYRLEATVASDGGNRVYLEFGNRIFTSVTLTDRTIGEKVEAMVCWPGGEARIGLMSPTWFEADNFKLYQIAGLTESLASSKNASLTLIGTVSDTETRQSPSVQRIYSVRGEQLLQFQKGIHLVKMSDGSLRKVLVK
ncbi:MAG: endonuclease/exonuclease/phosphatase family protein [Prevotella sp.]|nr:endonuclease/exonuclease/phosphatase family protein [Prevotella sp.]